MVVVPLGRETETRLYTRTRSRKEIEIRKWPRPRDSRSPDSNDFTLSPRRRRLVPTAERRETRLKSACRAEEEKEREKKRKEGIRGTRESIVRHAIRYLERKRWLEPSVAMRAASHRGL